MNFMACKLYLHKALKIKLKPKPINKGSGSLSEEEALVMTRDVVITESFQEEVVLNWTSRNGANLDTGSDARQGHWAVGPI